MLDRYLQDDTNIILKKDPKSNVPRFLLNDIVRFWRTMCVDFACKEWEQAQDKWALRNIKLRMSRKLIFVSGLLMCASGHMDENLELPNVNKDDIGLLSTEPLLMHFLNIAQMTPLQIIARALVNYSKENTTIQHLLGAYDGFLGILNDDEKRKNLEKLKPKDAYDDLLFNECRGYGHQFQEALTCLFFEDNKGLREFTISYGVF